MTARPAIAATFEQVAREQKKTMAPLTDGLVLLDSGLDSLCFAIITARLESKLGVDPFAVDTGGEFPVTFGAFVKFYDDAART